MAREILAPGFFKHGADIGTIWVRYVEPVDHSQTNLRIDAVFVDARNVSIHPSAGEVEAGEHRAIQDRLLRPAID